jgi:hypothetical protein
MHILLVTAYLFVMAILFAVFEIESEGKYGWAERHPTWYRVSGPVANIYRRVINKPLTGYHAALLFVPILIFFWPMVAQSTITWSGVFDALATYFAWVVVWDFAWFVLNPYYGVGNFRRDSVWWFGNELWVGRLLPLGYVSSWLSALAFAVASGWAGDDVSESALRQIEQFGYYLLLIGVLIFIGAPLFRRYYGYMRRKDERELAGIFH